jgi:branched-chain amino acid transport system permease protein
MLPLGLERDLNGARRSLPWSLAIAGVLAGYFGAGGFAAAYAQESTTTTVPATRGSAIAGTLTLDGKGVGGVKVTAAQNGKTVGEATSSDDGRWELEVPKPGVYQLTLDTETLPDGVTAQRSELPRFRVFGGFAQRALFPLSSGETSSGGGGFDWERFLNLVVSGIRFGLIVGLCSVGLSLIYGTTGLVNFAHGELVTFGALVAFYFNTMTSGPQLSLFIAAVLAIAATGLLGGAVELGVFRPMVRRRSGTVARMLVSIGLALLLRYFYQVIFLGAPRSYREFSAQSPIDIGPLSFPARDYWVGAISLVVLIVVAVVLRRTRLGTAVRAVSDERDLASASGIDVNRVVLSVWIGGAALAGLGGVLLAVSQSAQWNLGFRLLLTMFAAIILGGLGSAYGAMVGGLVVGVASQVSTYWLPADFQFAIALVILILVLMVRPQGILGVKERIG